MIPNSNDTLSAVKRAFIEIERLEAELVSLKTVEPIAIIGMGCKFPGSSNTPEQFWELLKNGKCAITDIPEGRWNIENFYDSNPNAKGKSYVKKGAFIDDVDMFDAAFWGMSPMEAEALDPQQRMLLEVTYRALENARLNINKLEGSKTAVYIGIGNSDYAYINSGDRNRIDAYSLTGTSASTASGRISYVFGFNGPCISIDTACSSSLVSVHYACQSLRNKDADMAVAGGVLLQLAAEGTIGLSKLRALAPDGICKTFDASADGYGRGEGCGIVVLKRLSDAIRDHDNILAVIKGSATNQDGKSNGLTAPNGKAQEEVITAALKNAGVKGSEVDYLEAHGTGTSLGDLIEVKALSTVLTKNRSNDNKLYLGSVKTNIGHAEHAAGMAGLFKVILSLQHKQIPAHLHLTQQNPHIPWAELPISIPQMLTDWESKGKPRIAGLSSFGFSGTNCHLILGEAPIVVAGTPIKRAETLETIHNNLLSISAKSEDALKELLSEYVTYLDGSAVDISSVCYSANVTNSDFNYRLAVQGKTKDEIYNALVSVKDKKITKDYVEGKVNASPKIAFLFTGQGAQYVGMARELYNTNAYFKKQLDYCDQLMQQYIGKSLTILLYDANATEELLAQTHYTQPALFCIEYALAELWKFWGVYPVVVMGHSVGEYVAACVAGIFSVEDGLKLICERGRLMQKLPDNGAMLNVFSNEEVLQPLLVKFSAQITIAAVNSKDNVTLAGEKDAIHSLLAYLDAAHISYKVLNVSHAFHSHLMDAMLDEFEKFAETIHYKAPAIQILSNVSGKLADENEMTTARYWRNHIRQSVQFEKSVKVLQELHVNTLIEVGPHATLLGLVKQSINDQNVLFIPTLRKGQADISQMQSSLAQLYVKGIQINWQNFYEDRVIAKANLPLYPFQRKKYWKSLNEDRQQLSVLSISTKHAPLIDQRILSPLADAQYSTDFHLEKFPFIKDHQVHGANVVPGALMAEAAFEVGRDLWGNVSFSICEMLILQALTLQEAESKKVYYTAHPLDKNAYQIKIVSMAEGKNENESQSWIEHAQLVIRKDRIVTPSIYQHNEIIERSAASRSGVEIYGISDQLGLVYKNNFRIVEQLWWAEKEALGKIVVPVNTNEKFSIHPAILDACFQVPAAFIVKNKSAEQIQSLYLPIHINTLTLYKQALGTLWVYFQLEHFEEDNILKGNITVKDELGDLVCFIDGFTLKGMKHHALKQHLNKNYLSQLSYNMAWKAISSDQYTQKNILTANHMIILCDNKGWGKRLKAKFEAYGKTCDIVYAGNEYGMLDAYYTINPRNFNDYIQLVAGLKTKSVAILNLWSFDCSLEQTVKGEVHYSLSCNLHFIKALNQKNRAASIYMLTRGVFAIEPFDGLPAIANSPAWGLGNVVPLEHGDIHYQMIDLSLLDYEEEVNKLVEEILTVNQKQHIAVRQNLVYVQKVEYRQQSKKKTLSLPPSEAYYLNITKRGLFDNLVLEKTERKIVGKGQVEIAVKASGLNFRDVLNVLGQYPGDPGLPGSECSGIVTHVGEGVKHIKVGDEVIAFGSMGGFGKYVIAQQEFIIKKPTNLSFYQAATLPIAYLTAWYALKYLAAIKKGDKILIHAAAGGVGLAAVNIARLLGAEIFATAGSEKKRVYLKQLGVDHILDSRNTDFAEYIQKATQHKGVDIILNSLTGKALLSSFDVIAQNGYFLEMGKAEIWDEEKIKTLNKSFTYLPFDLATVAQEDPSCIQQMFVELKHEFEKESLSFLPYQSFEIENAREAFRYMSQAKHIGKIIITQKDAVQYTIKDNATYLITGGLGGVGLVTTEYLIERGAKNIVLLGRKNPSAEQELVLDKWRKSAVNIKTYSVDICDESNLETVLNAIQTELPPLKGIFHAAGILDDGILEHQNENRFRVVMKPKVQGTWNLHKLTEHLVLDYFVMYSSIASCLGSPAQGNYAAANAFLDAFVSFRKYKGLAATTINWGPWSEVGMAHANSDLKKYELIGLNAISPSQGKEILDFVLKTEQEQIVAVDINWDKYKKILPLSQQWIVPTHSAVVNTSSQEERTYDIIQRLATLENADKKKIIVEFLQAESARILGYDASQKMDIEVPFNELGFDSLSAVELKNVLSSAFDIKLQPTVVFQYPTIHALAGFIYTHFDKKDAPIETPVKEENKEKLEEMLGQLSDEEMNNVLKELEAS